MKKNKLSIYLIILAIAWLSSCTGFKHVHCSDTSIGTFQLEGNQFVDIDTSTVYLACNPDTKINIVLLFKDKPNRDIAKKIHVNDLDNSLENIFFVVLYDEKLQRCTLGYLDKDELPSRDEYFFDQDWRDDVYEMANNGFFHVFHY